MKRRQSEGTDIGRTTPQDELEIKDEFIAALIDVQRASDNLRKICKKFGINTEEEEEDSDSKDDRQDEDIEDDESSQGNKIVIPKGIHIGSRTGSHCSTHCPCGWGVETESVGKKHDRNSQRRKAHSCEVRQLFNFHTDCICGVTESTVFDKSRDTIIKGKGKVSKTMQESFEAAKRYIKEEGKEKEKEKSLILLLSAHISWCPAKRLFYSNISRFMEALMVDFRRTIMANIKDKKVIKLLELESIDIGSDRDDKCKSCRSTLVNEKYVKGRKHYFKCHEFSMDINKTAIYIMFDQMCRVKKLKSPFPVIKTKNIPDFSKILVPPKKDGEEEKKQKKEPKNKKMGNSSGEESTEEEEKNQKKEPKKKKADRNDKEEIKESKSKKKKADATNEEKIEPKYKKKKTEGSSEEEAQEEESPSKKKKKSLNNEEEEEFPKSKKKKGSCG